MAARTLKGKPASPKVASIRTILKSVTLGVVLDASLFRAGRIHWRVYCLTPALRSRFVVVDITLSSSLTTYETNSQQANHFLQFFSLWLYSRNCTQHTLPAPHPNHLDSRRDKPRHGDVSREHADKSHHKQRQQQCAFCRTNCTL